MNWIGEFISHNFTLAFIIFSGFIIERWWEIFQSSQKIDKNLLSEWYSTFQTNEQPPRPDWAFEKIKIRRNWYYKLILETLEPYHEQGDEQGKYGYKWKSKKTLVSEDGYIYGTWESKSEPNSRGLLILLPYDGKLGKGQTLFGFFLVRILMVSAILELGFLRSLWKDLQLKKQKIVSVLQKLNSAKSHQHYIKSVKMYSLVTVT